MRIVFRFILIIISIGTGGMFLYSAWTKVLPIQPFEYTIVEHLHLPWLAASILARLMIGLEAALGGLIVLHLFGKNKLVLKLAFALLVLFSIYLVWLWASAGNEVNCGCFGDYIWMSPSASLIKNAVLLLFTAILIRWHHSLHFKWVTPITWLLSLVGVVLPSVLFPISIGKPSWVKQDKFKLDFTPLYSPIKDDTAALRVPYPDKPSIDLSNGKYIIAFVSPSCEHCRIAARKMSIMKKDNPSLPFFMIIGGIASDLTDFWKYTNSGNILYMRLHRNPFLDYTGGMFPQIFWINNGWVEAKSSYNTLNQHEIEQWMLSTSQDSTHTH